MGTTMDTTWYLTAEKLNLQNYPEVSLVAVQINTLITFGMRLNNAISDYINNTFDKVAIDVVELRQHIELCRSVQEVLGNATNVCFDILIPSRELQELLLMLMYIKNRYGSQYIGTPSTS